MRRCDGEENLDRMDGRLREPVVEIRLVGNARRLCGIPIDRDPALTRPECVAGRVECSRVAEGAGGLREPEDDVRGGAPAESERHDSAAGDKQALSHGGPFLPRQRRLPRGTAACIGFYDYFPAPTGPVPMTTATSSPAGPKAT